MRQFIFFLVTLFSCFVRAEITTLEERFYVSPGQPSRDRTADEQLIAKELNLAIKHLPKDKPTKFIYINRCQLIPSGKEICTTYVAQKNGTQWTLIDKYPTLAGVGRGVGCGSGQTEPGLFAIEAKQPAAHTHEHWGKSELLPMKPIKTNETQECASHDSEKVIHGRTSLDGKAVGVPQTGQTRGCVGVPTEKFDMMAQQTDEGAVILNCTANK